jgi:hypothetical protein
VEQTRPTEQATGAGPLPDERGHFGIYGGRFVAETLMPPLNELNEAYQKYLKDPDFQAELDADLTRSTIRSGRPCWPSAWGKSASLPRPVPVSTA